MISHKKKFIFVHIPKVAGTSIESILFPFASRFKCANKFAKEYRHLRNYELFNSQTSYSNYFSFTFVRNPFDRMVSLYHFFNFDTKISFAEFIEDVKIFLEQKPEKIYEKVPLNETRLRFRWANHRHDFQKDIEYNWLDDGNIGYHLLPQMYFLKNRIDFIGRFEQIKKDLKLVCDRLDIPNLKLPHERKSKHKHYTEYYNNRLVDLVTQVYSCDISNLGYKFED